MNSKPIITAALAALLAAGFAAPAHAYTWGGKLDMLVVAERADPTLDSASPTAAQPTTYVACDAGYIESGDPIAGLRPPSAADVARDLAAALASQHYLPAASGAAPSLALIYHWGLINRDSHQIRTSFRLQPNLAARIGLVSTHGYAARIEEDLLDRRQPVTPRVPIIDPVEQDLLHYAADNRYFVIISAYDFDSVARGDAKLVWRVKMSARSAGAAMAETLPTLLRGGAPFFGRDLPQTQSVREPLFAAPAIAAGSAPPAASVPLDRTYLDTLIHQEHVQFAGELTADDAK